MPRKRREGKRRVMSRELAHAIDSLAKDWSSDDASDLYLAVEREADLRGLLVVRVSYEDCGHLYGLWRAAENFSPTGEDLIWLFGAVNARRYDQHRQRDRTTVDS